MRMLKECDLPMRVFPFLVEAADGKAVQNYGGGGVVVFEIHCFTPYRLVLRGQLKSLSSQPEANVRFDNYPI
jgi:hypothetical protein